MPELPEVETVRRGLAPVMEGRRILKVEQNRPDLRFPFPTDFVRRLEGQTLTALGRRAKYLIGDLSSGEVLIMHLGMSGRFTIIEGTTPTQPGDFVHQAGQNQTHDHVIFHMEGDVRIHYNDARRFGFMDLVPRADFNDHRHIRQLGLEPLGNALNGAVIADLFAGKKTPLKAALLDQSLIAGLGNIYVCEALHRARLSPKRAAGTLVSSKGKPHAKAEELAIAIRDVLTEAVEAGGSTLRDYAQADGSLGYFQHAFRVYDREGAPCSHAGCKGQIQRIVQSGRSSFYCAQCQK
jgi:formamidopyrimidine-DNA glycosylase